MKVPAAPSVRLARLTTLLACCAALLVACAGDRPASLAAPLGGTGPRVVWDIEARPFPEIPFPNDAATRLDDTSPTGRRINIAREADTAAERRFRERLDELDGFGLLAPLSVRFDAPLDIRDLHDRQNDGDDASNDGILLIRLGDGEACGTGEADRLVPLDVGGGAYPLFLDRPCQYHFNLWEGDFICEPVDCAFGDDPRAGESNLIFETVEEDENGNGRLDPYEDTDFDGKLDHPNTWDGKPSLGADELVTFYERETNTLIAWPLVPLEEGARYAVVLTRHLKGQDGQPIRSPFEGLGPARQLDALGQLDSLLPCHGLSMADVAFAWVFTTGTPSRELLAIRDGLYGAGPLGASLGDKVPVNSFRPRLARDADEDGQRPPAPYTLPSDTLLPIMSPLSGQILETPGAGQRLTRDAAAVDYWVRADFVSPNFLVDKDGRATPKYPDDQDEIFDVDLRTGHATWAESRVPFLCSIPKATAEHKPPFPVIIYGHGYSGATFEILGFAGPLAKAGFALCGLEAPGHGLIIPADEKEIAALLDLALDAFGLRAFYDAYQGGRARDLDLDGMVGERDNGTDFWTADIFHTRDMLRQEQIDHLQFIRTLRAVDGRLRMETDTDGDGQPDLLADFNGDGVPDLGGWQDTDGDHVRGPDEHDNAIDVMGQSLGGITSAILAGIEPAVHAAAPVSSAGGLVHVGSRSTNLGVPEGVLLPILGPFVTVAPHGATTGGEGETDGRVDIGFLIAKVNQPWRPVFHVSSKVVPGDTIVVQNLRTGRERRGTVPESLRMRVGFAADALRLGERRDLLGIDENTALPVEVDERQARQLGDPLRVLVLDGYDGPVKETIDRVAEPFTFGGVRYSEGTPLVALAEGLGYTRQSPDLRRVLGVSQIAIEPGDPATYARYVRRHPLSYDYETGDVKAARDRGEHTRITLYHTVGDSDVPISAGITLARALGLIGPYAPDPAEGVAAMDTLISHHVVEGVERTMRYTQRKPYSGYCPQQVPDTEWVCPPVRLGEESRYRDFFTSDPVGAGDMGTCSSCGEGGACFYDDLCVAADAGCDALAEAPIEAVHFDVMDLDAGRDRLTLPEYNLSPPLRPTWQDADGVDAFRIPYLRRNGSHGVPPSIPERAFDINGFVVNQLLWYFAQDGKELSDDPCLADETCAFVPWMNAAH
ncbi:MAG: hypothetical protein H6746_02655 [Deltaproteobacteria bacterium]|nr:hypothetical protein [Deltaproteobacteria bacterium]